MSYRRGLGDVLSQAGTPAVRTRYPSGPNAGELADRYATYSDIPLLLRAFAQQLGAAGYWYVPPANPLETLEDQGSRVYDVTTGGIASGINYASDSVLGFSKTTLALGAIALGALWALPSLLSSRRR